MQKNMMKKSFSLVEVLIAVVILSIAITALIQTNQNNLFLLEKFQDASKSDGYISLALFGVDSNKTSDTNFYLDDVVDFKDDESRKELKELKVTLKKIILEEQTIQTDALPIKLQTTQINLKIENQKEQNFYQFKLN
jgi:hypothetical protein